LLPALGGTARVIGESTPALRRLGREVWVLVGAEESRPPRRVELDRITVLGHAISSLVSTLGLSATAVPNGARPVSLALRRHGPFDLLHSHGLEILAEVGEEFLVAARTGVPSRRRSSAPWRRSIAIWRFPSRYIGWYR
jgi:glycosyltransferase involved in cell wall biosynthesis